MLHLPSTAELQLRELGTTVESDVCLTELFEIRRSSPATYLDFLFQSNVLGPLDSVREDVERVEVGHASRKFGLHRTRNLINLNVLRAVMLENGSRGKVAVCDFFSADVDEV